MALHFTAYQMSLMPSATDVLLTAEMPTPPLVTLPASGAPPINHPKDDFWSLIIEPQQTIQAYDATLKRWFTLVGNVSPILILSYGYETDSTIVIHAFARTQTACLSVSEKQVAPESPQLESLLAGGDTGKSLESRISDYLELSESQEIPDFWAGPLRRLLQQAVPDFSEDMSTGTKAAAIANNFTTTTTPSPHTIQIQATGLGPGGSPMGATRGIFTAHFSLLQDPTASTAKQEMEDFIYAILRSPHQLEIAFPVYAQIINGSTAPTVKKLTVRQDKNLRVIYHANTIVTIVQDGCTKLTGYWEENPMTHEPEFHVTSVTIEPWGGG